jgi:hypothetical protein
MDGGVLSPPVKITGSRQPPVSGPRDEGQLAAESPSFPQESVVFLLPIGAQWGRRGCKWGHPLRPAAPGPLVFLRAQSAPSAQRIILRARTWAMRPPVGWTMPPPALMGRKDSVR